MKASTLIKYNEIIEQLKHDPEGTQIFLEGRLVIAPENDTAEYCMKLNQVHELELFCRPRGENGSWIKYEAYQTRLAETERRRKEAEAHAAFKKELFEKARAEGSCMTEKQFKLIFARAYEDEHSSGMESVRESFFELIEFIEEIIDAGLES